MQAAAGICRCAMGANIVIPANLLRVHLAICMQDEISYLVQKVKGVLCDGVSSVP